MLSHHPAVSAAIKRGSASRSRSLARIVSAIVLATALAGCNVVHTASVGVADPADPDVPVRGAGYKPVLSGYVSQRPVSPKPWREQNERVTPKGSAQ